MKSCNLNEETIMDREYEIFWQCLVAEYHWGDKTEGQVLASAIDAAFTSIPGSDSMPVDHKLVQYMAGWMRENMNGDPQHGEQTVRGHNANHFLKRAFEGLYMTVMQNVIEGHRTVRGADGDDPMYGCLRIPSQLVAQWQAVAVERNQYRRETQGKIRPYAVAD
jgi:hypothetical protein